MSKYSLKDLVTIFNLESIFDKERDNLDFEHLNLSGGEKQRICLARAIYRNKKWLFLDEAFSAIDKTNSDRIHQFILSDPYLTVLSIEQKDCIYECGRILKQYFLINKIHNKNSIAKD